MPASVFCSSQPPQKLPTLEHARPMISLHGKINFSLQSGCVAFRPRGVQRAQAERGVLLGA